MQEAVVILRYHASAVHADTRDFERRPHGIAGKQLVVGTDSCELHHTEFHDHMVDQLLRLLLRQNTALQITLNINIKECGNTSDGHRRAVLGLDRGKIAEIQPLNRFFRVCRRLRNIKPVRRCHGLHILQRLDLIRELFPQADNVIGHGSVAAVFFIVLLPGDQLVNTVQSNSSVVADNTSTAIGVR